MWSSLCVHVLQEVFLESLRFEIRSVSVVLGVRNTGMCARIAFLQLCAVKTN